jgi:hypothetical protein
MSLLNLWPARGQQAAVQAEMAPRLWPETHLPLTDPSRIARLLSELVATGPMATLHLPGAHAPLPARLTRAAGQSVHLAAAEEDLPAGAAHGMGMVMVSLPLHASVLMFGLRLLASPGPDGLLGLMPDELLQVQSREFRRVHCPGGDHSGLRLHLQGLAPHLSWPVVADISEGGAGVHMGGPLAPDVGWTGSGELTQGNSSIPVPLVKVLHRRQARDGRWRAGLQFGALEGSAACALRRLLNEQETAAIRLRPDG